MLPTLFCDFSTELKQQILHLKHVGESASSELQQFLEKNSPRTSGGGWEEPAQLPSTIPTKIQAGTGAKMPKPHWDVLRSRCTVPGKCSASPLPSQSNNQPAALRNASKIFQGLSQSLPLGCRTPQQICDSPLKAFPSPVSVTAIKKYKLSREKKPI